MQTLYRFCGRRVSRFVFLLGALFMGVLSLALNLFHMAHHNPATRVARADYCINSACDQPCTPRRRFVRHAGVCIK